MVDDRKSIGMTPDYFSNKTGHNERSIKVKEIKNEIQVFKKLRVAQL